MALLLERGGGTMLYDTDLDITWLADANYAGTSGFHPTGALSLDVAVSWLSGLEFAGYSDWRLILSVVYTVISFIFFPISRPSVIIWRHR